MVANQIVLIFFRLLNFAVLLGIFYFMWRRFGRQAVQDAFDQEEENLNALSRTHIMLRKENDYIKKAVRAEHEERTVLKERLFMWRDAVSKRHQAMERTLDERRKKLDARLSEQVERVGEFRLLKAVQDDVLLQAKKGFEDQYSSEETQQKMLELLFKKMGQS